MIGFIAGAAALLASTVGLLAWPLLRRSSGTVNGTRALTAAVYRDKLVELEQDLVAGHLTPSDYDQSRIELQRRLLEDSNDTESTCAPAGTGAPKDTGLFVALATVLPMVAIGLYILIGQPGAVMVDSGAHPSGAAGLDVEKMVAGLAARLEKEPDNVRGWAMLARSYQTLGRYEEAVKAYAKTGTWIDDQPDLLVSYADAVASAAHGFNEASLHLLERALTLDPKHPQGLWMRGSTFFDAGRFDRAAADWEALLPTLPADSDDAKAIRANIEEAHRRAVRK